MEPIHKIYNEGEQTYVERLNYPRFRAEIIFSSDILKGDLGEPEWIDPEPPPAQFMLIARLLREAGEFVANYKP